MRLWVGVTDRNWFEFLRARQPDEVNFWQPSSRRRAAVLEAAYIRTYTENGPLLCSDLRRLFDRGYITVTDDLRVQVRRRIREEFANVREYSRHDGQPLGVAPGSPHEHPSLHFLRWHNESRFPG